jgi:hypothetical protein
MMMHVKRIPGLLILSFSPAFCRKGVTSDGVNQVKLKSIKLVFVASPLKHAALRRKSKDWLALNQDNVSKWGDISISRLLFQ